MRKKKWEPRTSMVKKPGYTMFCGLWDGVDADGKTTGGAMYMNDKDAARLQKEKGCKRQDYHDA